MLYTPTDMHETKFCKKHARSRDEIKARDMPGERRTAAARLQRMFINSAAPTTQLAASGAPERSSGRTSVVPRTKQLPRATAKKIGNSFVHSVKSLAQSLAQLSSMLKAVQRKNSE